MIFRPELAQAVMEGTKTVTRRPVAWNERSPWWSGRCRYRQGGFYAVQPGRGQRSIGTIRVVSVRKLRLGRLDDEEARREGFGCAASFEAAWKALHGGYDPAAHVWRVEFEAVT